ncbi:hypothetical protein Nepgr_016744 [Nepenthes gracilis]|uniref:Uncharacterized protein n=1 Tax=Nepenthes gracilis TaxID=150966 RepID=A0AAD3SP46_NEPGR|nr:hypothetical protein Nepgr_016744 [Nepenthes gracilis]
MNSELKYSFGRGLLTENGRVSKSRLPKLKSPSTSTELRRGTERTQVHIQTTNGDSSPTESEFAVPLEREVLELIPQRALTLSKIQNLPQGVTHDKNHIRWSKYWQTEVNAWISCVTTQEFGIGCCQKDQSHGARLLELCAM